MSKFVEVEIAWDGKTVTVKPETVQLYYDHPEGPDSIKWKFVRKGGNLRPHDYKIVFDTCGPFGKVTPKKTSFDKNINGTDNKKQKGRYHYAVLIVDERGQIVGGVDPLIENEPLP